MLWIEENILFATTTLVIIEILESLPLPFWCFTSKLLWSLGLLYRRLYLFFFRSSVCDFTFHKVIWNWLLMLIILSWCSCSWFIIYLRIDSFYGDNRMGFLRIIHVHVVVVLGLRVFWVLGHHMLANLGPILIIWDRNCIDFFALGPGCLKSIILTHISLRHLILFCLITIFSYTLCIFMLVVFSLIEGT